MVLKPTRLERFLGLRINLCIFGYYIGTGHLTVQRNYDTDTDDSDSEDSLDYI